MNYENSDLFLEPKDDYFPFFRFGSGYGYDIEDNSSLLPSQDELSDVFQTFGI